ncbi:M15 family metallopeptidase [Metabacillus arenae]|uniref:M15 family metallopeptidase n=1 Tax=Metabacillus arenae TaxID=2771434 RepID=A0A926RUX1_9BACI|nr:M15 family metallopeptidase [Metabacillus arenae]MBD1379038.1 M15 family metallopeptidase [Metabacillus arenae]
MWYKKLAAGSVSFLLLAGCSNLDFSKGFFQEDVKTESVQPEVSSQSKESNKKNQEEVDKDFLLKSSFFNEVKQVNGKATIQNPDNSLVLVNKEFALPENYTPEDLVFPDVPFSFGDAEIPQRYLREEAAIALKQLFNQAKKEQIELFAVSGFRSYERQQGIFNVEKDTKGEEEAKQAVAIPGQSEHQTGLAMDISSRSVNLEITEAFGETKEGKWVSENAHKFGFIIRYQQGKEDITGYQYEPWHLRYVGKEAAKVMFEHDLTLEEYFERVKKI